jgi:hypothetical protein
MAQSFAAEDACVQNFLTRRLVNGDEASNVLLQEIVDEGRTRNRALNVDYVLSTSENRNIVKDLHSKRLVPRMFETKHHFLHW